MSKSGRIVIAPEGWNVACAMSLAGIKPRPDHCAMQRKVAPRFVDEFTPPGGKEAATETLLTLAQ